jgi:hypothetical protein
MFESVNVRIITPVMSGESRDSLRKRFARPAQLARVTARRSASAPFDTSSEALAKEEAPPRSGLGA